MNTSRLPRSVAALVAVAVLGIAACSGDRPSPLSPIASSADKAASSLQATRHIIVLQKGKTSAQVVARVQALGGRVERLHEGAGLITVRGLNASAVSTLRSHPDVLSVGRERVRRWIPVRKFTRLATPPRGRARSSTEPPGGDDDQSGAAFFAFQWDMRIIRANNVWKLRDGHGKGTLVCDLDTGVDPTHIDLKGKIDMAVSTSFVVNEPDILDRNTHGTYVSALISSNGIGMASVAPDARLCQLKVLDQTGSGSDIDIITAIVYAADQHVDVANMSFGGYLHPGNADDEAVIDAFERAADYAHAHGVTLVAAAGNEGLDLPAVARDSIDVPGEIRHVISVGATAPTNLQPGTFYDLASYTNFGYPGTTLFAPGGDLKGPIDASGVDLILSACSSFATDLPFSCADHQSYIIDAGTSAASPHVAGEASILASDGLSGNPERIRHCVIDGTDRVYSFHIPDPLTGFGFEDVLGGKDCRHLI